MSVDANLLVAKFEQIGSRARVRWDERSAAPVAVDIRRDREGQYFDLALGRRANPSRVEVIDARPRERHLLLMTAPERGPGGTARVPSELKRKFLCGHDEREWFVAAVPERAAAANVRGAMEALKPVEVRRRVESAHVPFDRRNDRRNAAFVRQGEWFFVRAFWPEVRDIHVTRNELIRRTGGGKPHVAEFACRTGGEPCYFDSRSGRAYSIAEFARLRQAKPEYARTLQFQRRNARLLVRGRVRHPDHATILLREWHEVLMNTEHQAEAMRFVAFID
ncbi:MAG: hypothetical protein ACAI43_04170 [Phycisphaerae bacterium]|nr:hypothetical protein [Tepidisphaeraceae bacterium]